MVATDIRSTSFIKLPVSVTGLIIHRDRFLKTIINMEASARLDGEGWNDIHVFVPFPESSQESCIIISSLDIAQIKIHYQIMPIFPVLFLSCGPTEEFPVRGKEYSSLVGVAKAIAGLKLLFYHLEILVEKGLEPASSLSSFFHDVESGMHEMF